MVSASSATSPEALTVIFCFRSPAAMAWVTVEMERTWSVRFDAIVLTASVRDRHVPETPLTSAWPPSLPSVPTSWETRVTSAAKRRRRPTIWLTVSPRRRNSPRSCLPSNSRAASWVRSPAATASRTRPSSVVGRTSSSTRRLTLAAPSRQPPSRCSMSSRWFQEPSWPTTRAMSARSRLCLSARSTTALKRSTTSPARPSPRGSRTEKSPRSTAPRASASVRRRSDSSVGGAEAALEAVSVMALFLS